MKKVNLLPDWYLQQRRDRQTMQLRAALVFVLVAVMAGWVYVARAEVRRLTDIRDELPPPGKLVAKLPLRLEDETSRVHHYESLLSAYRDVGNTVPMSKVLQQVQNNLAPGMALSRATIDVRAEPLKNSGMVGDAANPPKLHDVAHFSVMGVAPNDTLIAQLIGKLANNPLFNDIALNYTRTDVLRDYSVRRFEIQMAIDLDRLATEDPAEGPRVAGTEAAHGD